MARSPAAKLSLDKQKNPHPYLLRSSGGQLQDRVTLINMGRSKDYISPATKERSKLRLIAYLCKVQTKIIKISRHVKCTRQSRINLGQEIKENSVISQTSSQLNDSFNSSFVTSTPKRLKNPHKECWGKSACKVFHSWDAT